MPELFIITWNSIDGRMYHIEFDEFMNSCKCGNDWECNCPEPEASRMTYERACQVKAAYDLARESAKTGEAFDNSPHNVEIRKAK